MFDWHWYEIFAFELKACRGLKLNLKVHLSVALHPKHGSETSRGKVFKAWHSLSHYLSRYTASIFDNIQLSSCMLTLRLLICIFRSIFILQSVCFVCLLRIFKMPHASRLWSSIDLIFNSKWINADSAFFLIYIENESSNKERLIAEPGLHSSRVPPSLTCLNAHNVNIYRSVYRSKFIQPLTNLPTRLE